MALPFAYFCRYPRSMKVPPTSEEAVAASFTLLYELAARCERRFRFCRVR
jgi:hypothetical protein